MRTTIAGLTMTLAGLGIAAAQQEKAERRIEVRQIEVGPGSRGGAVWVGQGGEGPMPLPPADGHFEFLAAGPMSSAKVVKGAPYTAEGISETVQVLADGTRITRRNTKKFARDSQGRTREEITLSTLGPWAASGDAIRMVHILDPVAGEMIILNEKEKTARRLKIGTGGAVGISTAAVRLTHPVPDGGAGPAVNVTRDVVVVRRQGSEEAKVESLGRQTMEGVAVDGTRTTRTIAAGEIGNDRAIVVVTEEWVSPDLQVTVRVHTNDPQFGETDYRLSGIRRVEPAGALFTAPAEYKEVSDSASPVMIRQRVTKP
ncbi:MAG: hypothetical protein R2729_29115 [Bryobacteraceae bacterium]